MTVISWIGAFVLGVLAQALADQGARSFDGATWFLSAPLRLLASGLSLWLWLLIGYPIWSVVRRMPTTETPFQLLGLALATVGVLLALGMLLDYLAPLRPIVLLSLFVPMDLFPLGGGLTGGLDRPARILATLALSGAAIGLGGYLGRRA